MASLPTSSHASSIVWYRSGSDPGSIVVECELWSQVCLISYYDERHEPLLGHGASHNQYAAQTSPDYSCKEAMGTRSIRFLCGVMGRKPTKKLSNKN
jgi:hypothetical protein